MREPVDPGPDTRPSLEARPDPFEPLAAHPEPTAAHPQHAAIAVDARRGPQPPLEPPPPPAQLPEQLPAQPVAVPGQYHYLKRWTFVPVLIGVWIPAALIGLLLYYYWFHSIDKTPAVFLLLVVIVVSTVSGQLMAMVDHKPLITAAAIAVMSAPFAATAAAAALHGAYAFGWVAR
ncbi:MAG: hypothetical protein QOE41_3110 [Mycobacterium sp.]|nr:hypothetical protein [Mycobacterium sp.]